MEIAEHHECEVFKSSGGHEAAESQYKWDNCTKNPGHEKFISAQDFKDNQLLKLQDDRSREVLQCRIDLTLRLRVHYTSRERLDHDEFSHARGSHCLRRGTGFIHYIFPHMSNELCPCSRHNGEMTEKQWRFWVYTAHHVVYNTEEAKETKVDLFLDDDSCERDGRMKSEWGVEVVSCDPDIDRCIVECVTCDEKLAERIDSACCCYMENYNTVVQVNLSELDVKPSFHKGCAVALIVSHPHGQPKKITVGEVRQGKEYPHLMYTTPTCPGSSGAQMFRFKCNRTTDMFDVLDPFYFPQNHSGSY